ncbi:MAG: glycosyltransferase [Candidatus Fimenecus sp.]
MTTKVEQYRNRRKYSVLMSVYKKENADFFYSAIESIFNQSVPTNDFVLVCDGELTPELNAVIDKILIMHNDVFNVVRLEKNSGLGRALNIGIKYCKNELVARMDSDDISRKDRCEKQLEIFDKYSEVDICSGTVEEFTVKKEDSNVKRILPEKHNDIMEFAKMRNPFNHPCVMYKKSAVEKAGGYLDFFLLEDYYLWIRMLQNGAIGYNIQEPILWMRAGAGMYKRRSGYKYIKSQIRLLEYMNESLFINKLQFIKGIVIRTISSLLPNVIRKMVFKTALREKR